MAEAHTPSDAEVGAVAVELFGTPALRAPARTPNDRSAPETKAYLASQRVVSEMQAVRLAALARHAGYSRDAIARLLRHYGYAEAADVRACDYETLCHYAADPLLGEALGVQDVPAVERATGRPYRAHVQEAEPPQVQQRRILSGLRDWELHYEVETHRAGLRQLAVFYINPAGLPWHVAVSATYHAERLEMALDELLFRLGRYHRLEEAIADATGQGMTGHPRVPRRRAITAAPALPARSPPAQYQPVS